MKLSTTTRYGLRALADLGRQEEGKPIPVSGIAGRQGIPLHYLQQLFAKLCRGGLVQSVRGAQGGYTLSRPPREITVAQVVEALGEDIAFGDCQTGEGCLNAPDCPTFQLWHKVKGVVNGILETTTLEDVLGGTPEEALERAEARERALARQAQK